MRINLREKSTALFVLCTLVPVSIVALGHFAYTKRALNELVHNDLGLVTESTLRELEAKLTDAVIDIETWSGLTVMQAMVEPGAAAPIGQELDSLLRHHPLFAELQVVDPTGRPVAASARGVRSAVQPLSEFRPLTQLPVHSGQHLQPALLTAQTPLQFAAPILRTDRPQAVAGYLIGVIDWGAVRAWLASIPLAGAPQSADRLLVLVSHRDHQVIYGSPGTTAEVQDWLAEHVHGHEPHHENHFEEAYIIGLSEVAEESQAPAAGLELLAAISHEAAFASVAHLRLKALVVALGSVVLAVLLGWLGVQRIVRPITAVTSAMRRLAAGDLEARLPDAMQRRRDEIGDLVVVFGKFRENAIERFKAEAHLRHEATQRRSAQVALEIAQVREEEQSKHRDSLEQALRTQEEYNRLQREFVAMASHEFRTPLAIIDLAAQQIARKADRYSPGELSARAGNIRDAVARMQQLMESTLHAEQLNAGQIRPEMAPFDLSALLTLVCERQTEISPSCGIRLDLRDLPEAFVGDRRLLDQVFTNLLSNAVKYSPDKASVLLAGRRSGEDLCISFSDEGVGIPADEMPRLFQLYFRARTAAGIAGTGIGLNLARELVELHGGRIEVTSREGQGSTFTVWLPVRRRDAQPNDAPAAPGAVA